MRRVLRFLLSRHTAAILVFGALSAALWYGSPSSPVRTEPFDRANTVVSPRGNYLASQAEHGVVEVLDTSTLGVVHRLAHPHEDISSPECFSPDGRYLVTLSH